MILNLHDEEGYQLALDGKTIVIVRELDTGGCLLTIRVGADRVEQTVQEDFEPILEGWRASIEPARARAAAR